MKRLRFSLLGLATATAAIALACGALVRASGWIADITWAGTFLCLTLTVLCAMLVAPSRRGFWIGFSLFGWMYVLLTTSPLADRPNVPSLQPLLWQAAEAMPQAKGVEAVTIDASRMAIVEQLAEADANQTANAESVALRLEALGALQVAANTDFIESFVFIAQALIALLLGFIGGFAGHIIRQRSHPVAPTVSA